MKRALTRKRHRPEEIVAKLRETDEALAQGKSLEDVSNLFIQCNFAPCILEKLGFFYRQDMETC